MSSGSILADIDLIMARREGRQEIPLASIMSPASMQVDSPPVNTYISGNGLLATTTTVQEMPTPGAVYELEARVPALRGVDRKGIQQPSKKPNATTKPAVRTREEYVANLATIYTRKRASPAKKANTKRR
jgi:hypothetical protein